MKGSTRLSRSFYHSTWVLDFSEKSRNFLALRLRSAIKTRKPIPAKKSKGKSRRRTLYLFIAKYTFCKQDKKNRSPRKRSPILLDKSLLQVSAMRALLIYVFFVIILIIFFLRTLRYLVIGVFFIIFRCASIRFRL